MLCYKLFRKRKDGSLGSLFINRRDKLQLRTWLKAESHPTKGYAVRPGWHCCLLPYAPHLKQNGDRIWKRVLAKDVELIERPFSQGGTWVLAKEIFIEGDPLE